MPRILMAAAIVRAGVLALALLIAPFCGMAPAQDRPGPALEVEAGWAGFPDDGLVNEALVGGALRFYLGSSISVGPEVVYINGSRHSHLVVTGNVTWDIIGPSSGGPPRLTPFLVAGGGFFRTRESFTPESFTSTEGAFTAGGGVRASIGDRVTAGVEARFGWELHLRINALLGVRLGS